MEEEIYHIYNRGVEKRDIFLDERDYKRFMEGLKMFNSSKPFDFYHRRGSPTSPKDVGLPPPSLERLVEIICFCLMPNHFHLTLRALVENGITQFMRKLGTGYTKYFNAKYERNGYLFQGKYKRREVKDDGDLIYLTAYIHLNPVLAKLSNRSENYKWSSYRDFIEKNNNGIINIDRNLLEINANNYKKLIVDLAEDKEWAKKIDSIIID